MEGSVSAAARRVHVSQSAMSHALARLRELFGDPLLTPLGRGLTPTPWAIQLRAALPAAFEQLRLALALPEPSICAPPPASSASRPSTTSS